MKSQIQFTERHSRITNKKIDNSGMHLWKGTHQFSRGLMIDETVRDNLLKNSKIDRNKSNWMQTEIATVSWQDTSSKYNHEIAN